jgi:flagellar biosynthesis/type III secretory pathway protein FliH
MADDNPNTNPLQEFEQLSTRFVVDNVGAEIELAKEINAVNEQVEIDEVFRKLKYFSDTYKAGFTEGFKTGRELMKKHDALLAENIHRKYLDLKRRLGITGETEQ